MRLLERDPRTDASTPSAWLPTRTTQASNFSLASRAACSEFIETASMPNCRKHSESRLREGSCRSTNAARARSFLEEDKGTREFPKAISCDRSCAGYFVRRQGSSRPTLSSSRPSGYGVKRPMPPKRHSGAGFAPRQSRISTVTGTKVLLPEVTRSPPQVPTRCHQGNESGELNRNRTSTGCSEQKIYGRFEPCRRRSAILLSPSLEQQRSVGPAK